MLSLTSSYTRAALRLACETTRMQYSTYSFGLRIVRMPGMLNGGRLQPTWLETQVTGLLLYSHGGIPGELQHRTGDEPDKALVMQYVTIFWLLTRPHQWV